MSKIFAGLALGTAGLGLMFAAASFYSERALAEGPGTSGDGAPPPVSAAQSQLGEPVPLSVIV